MSHPLGDLVLYLSCSIAGTRVSGAPRSLTVAMAQMNASTVNPYEEDWKREGSMEGERKGEK